MVTITKNSFRIAKKNVQNYENCVYLKEKFCISWFKVYLLPTLHLSNFLILQTWKLASVSGHYKSLFDDFASICGHFASFTIIVCLFVAIQQLKICAKLLEMCPKWQKCFTNFFKMIPNWCKITKFVHEWLNIGLMWLKFVQNYSKLSKIIQSFNPDLLKNDPKWQKCFHSGLKFVQVDLKPHQKDLKLVKKWLKILKLCPKCPKSQITQKCVQTYFRLF